MRTSGSSVRTIESYARAIHARSHENPVKPLTRLATRRALPLPPSLKRALDAPDAKHVPARRARHLVLRDRVHAYRALDRVRERGILHCLVRRSQRRLGDGDASHDLDLRARAVPAAAATVGVSSSARRRRSSHGSPRGGQETGQVSPHGGPPSPRYPAVAVAAAAAAAAVVLRVENLNHRRLVLF